MYYPNGFAPISEDIDPKVVEVRSRIGAISGYGYALNGRQQSFLDSRLKLFRQNGGLPDWYLAPDIGVNKNLFDTSTTLSTKTITLAVGSYTFSFQSGAGSITSSNGTGTASNHGAVSAGGSRTIAVSVAGTFTFTVASTVNNAQLEVGSTATTYTARTDNTAVKSFNFGAKNASGDASFVGGSSSNMLTADAAGQSHNFLAASSQGLQAAFADWYPNYSYIIAYRPNSLGGALLIKSNASDRIVVNGDGSFRFNGTTGVVQSAVGALTAGGWVIVGVTVSGTTVKLYKNGVLLTPGTNTLSARNVEAATNWSISTSSFLNGLEGESVMIPATLSDAQMTNIFNGMKAKYGL
jgi:hypothetical protein